MARSMRLEYPGAIYHVTARGNERRAIYRDEGDYAHFLECLETCVQAFRVRLYLFCLMPNHFHLLVETPRANLGLFMHFLLTRYTVYFNRRHHRRGHLTQGRYSAKVVDGGGQGNKYLFALSRYIHLNPVERFCGVKRDEILRRQRRTNVRGLEARWLCRYAGFTQRKAARVLGLNTGAAISLQLRNLFRQIAGEAAFRERIIVAEKRLDRKAV